jgi:hypothetical protein
MHFEDLWEKCENYHSENSTEESSSEVIHELMMKLKLYSTIIDKSETQLEDIKRAKSRLMGEILLSLSALSLKDNINVFNAMNTALIHHNIEDYSDKYSG